MKKRKMGNILVLSALLTLSVTALSACKEDNTTQTSTDITIGNAVSQMEVGDSLTLTATSGKATLEGVTWSSSNPTVLTVDSALGTVRAHSVGSATITASKEGYTSTSITITVVDPTLENMSITLGATSIYAGQTTTISAKSESGFTLDNVTYRSSNENVAVVGNGIVRGLNPGTTTITATREGYNPATATLTVLEGEAPAQTYLIRFNDITGVTFSCDVDSAEAGETVQFSVTPDEGIEVLNVTMNGTRLESDGSGHYSFTMPNQDVTISASITLANAEIYVDGDMTFALIETETPGLYKATQTIPEEVSLNFRQKDETTNTVKSFSIQDIDVYKSFAKIENPADYHNYQFTLPGGFTYEFYFDKNATTRPIYIRRISVDTLPTNATQFENLFDSGNQRLSVFPQDVRTVAYTNEIDNVKYNFTRYNGNKSVAKITNLQEVETALVYKSIDNNVLTIVDNYVESDTDQTSRGDTTPFSLRAKVYETESEAASSSLKTLDEPEGWRSNGNKGSVTNEAEAIFQANYYSHNYNSLEFEFMDAYRTGFQSDYLQSSNISVSSVENATDHTFTTTITSYKTLVDSTNSIYEHYVYNLEITFDEAGKILEGSYLETLYGRDAYDFSLGNEGFLPGGEQKGTTVNEFNFAYTYGDLSDATSTDLPDVSPYFIQTIDSIRINNDDENTDPSKNVLRRNDEISIEEGTLEIEFSPSTALDVDQYNVISSSDENVIGPGNIYYLYQAKKEGSSTLTIGNGVTDDPTVEVNVEVGNSVKFHSAYFDGTKYNLNTVVSVDTANKVTVYDQSTSQVYLGITPDTASNQNLTFVIPEQYQSIVSLSYDPDTYLLTIVTQKVAKKTEVRFTIESPDKDPKVSSIGLTINILPKPTTTLDDLVGNWVPSKEQDSMIGSTNGHTLVFTNETVTVSGSQDTWYKATVSTGTVSKDFAYRIEETYNTVEACSITSGEYVYIDYNSETHEFGIVYELQGSWEGQDSGMSNYLIGTDTDDEDLYEYIYEYFVKA